jgi:DNA mismatch repair protein MutL
MPRIAILPSAVADQIAAGEVVERPASVVKELVENAIDAGATTVDITIEDGGRALIRVADDGCGMERDDAMLALERHATSKLTSAEQLVGVASFGFRGEALPAIASVSQLELDTSPTDGDGTGVRVSGGTLLDVRPVARRRGTTISVAQLFYNTPARRKFLRSARSEARAIIDTMQSIAMLRNDVHFLIRSDGKPVLDAPVAANLRERMATLWGHREVARFLDVDDVQGTVHVSGLVERPADVGTASRRVLLIVNGRVVRDHGLVRAAEAAYRSTIPSGVRPSMVLQLRLSAADVDVNVHPAKAEVRLRDRWPVERAVEGAVRRALGNFDASAGMGWRTWSPASPATLSFEAGTPLEPSALPTGRSFGGMFSDSSSWNTGEAAQHDASTLATAETNAGPAAERTTPEDIVVPPLMQLRRTYLMFEHDEGMVLIDQHSAHERVLFEQFMGTLERGAAPAQRLLFPMTLHLGADEADAFESSRDAFEALGFEIDAFGGHSLIVSAVPMPHPRFDAERCLRETLAALTGDRLPSAAKRHERLAATFACKAAIKAGDQLSPGEMRALYVALAETTLPAHDVHGRATIVRIGWDEIDRRFGRR